jgi:hypothetical protein
MLAQFTPLEVVPVPILNFLYLCWHLLIYAMGTAMVALAVLRMSVGIGRKIITYIK